MAENERIIIRPESPTPVRVTIDPGNIIRVYGQEHRVWTLGNPETARKIGWALLDLTDDFKTEETDR